MAAKSKVRGIYRRSFRPNAEECERRLVEDWYALCDEVNHRGADTGFAHVYTRRLHDWGVFRERAMKREAR